MSHRMKQIYPDTWKPTEINECIEGEIFESGYVASGEKTYQYLDLLLDGYNPIRLFVSGAVLKRMMDLEKPEIGGYLVVQWLGTSTTIQNRGNFMEKFAYCYYKPGEYTPSSTNIESIDVDTDTGEITEINIDESIENNESTKNTRKAKK